MLVSSFLRRNLIIPIWVFKDKSPRLRYMKEMEKSQYYNLQRLKENQFILFKKILDHAYRHTSYYKNILDKHGITPQEIRDESDIKKIPILTKNDIQNNFDSLISDTYKKETLIPFKTGGSTGKSITVLKDFRCMELEVGSAYRSFRWAGWNLGVPWGRVWGNPPERVTLKQKLHNILIEPQIYLDTMNMSSRSMFEFIEKWNKLNPKILHGHSHSIYIFAEFCKNQKIDTIRPDGIISTSMMLMEPERNIIEDAFQCKVTNLYGCEEVALIGCECEKHKGLHLNMENIFVETINSKNNNVSYGEQGAIVVTSLLNMAMPLIRYKIEDMGVLSNGKCSCGRCLPLLEKITGRVADFLVKKDGSLVAGVSLVERTLTALPGIRQLQIIQEDMSNIIINLVKGNLYNENIGRELIQVIKTALEGYPKIQLNFLKKIPPEASGKYRFSISHVKNPFMRGN